MSNKEKTSYTITPEAKQHLRLLAKAMGINRSAVLEVLIRQEVERRWLIDRADFDAIVSRELSEGPPNSIIHPR